MRYRIDLSYNGSKFCGWQIQPDAPSVQGALEAALHTLLKEDITATGAGRTDTGVHASMYVAHFDSAAQFDPQDLRYKLNALLPSGIAIAGISAAAPDFHARFDAKRREYTYFLHRVKDPFIESTSYYYGYPQVDFEAMNKAASSLLGTHDFSCFEKTGGDNKTSVCTVFEACWEKYSPQYCASSQCAASSQAPASSQVPESSQAPASSQVPESSQAQAPPQYATFRSSDYYWFFRISADRFLRNMVRAIVGTLLEVGRGKRSAEDFASLIFPPSTPVPAALSDDANPDECAPISTVPEGAVPTALSDDANPKECVPEVRISKRSMAGESVPGHALFLSRVSY